MTPFTTADNPYIQRESSKPGLPPGSKFVPKRYTAEDGRVFEETGEVRPAKKGEFIAGPMSALFGPAVANRDTEKPYVILRLVEGA